MRKTSNLFGKCYIKMLYTAHIIPLKRNPDGLQVWNVKNKIIEVLKQNERILGIVQEKGFLPLPLILEAIK